MKITAICLMGLLAVLAIILSVAAIQLADREAPEPVVQMIAPPGTIGASLDADGRWHCPAAYPRVAWLAARGVYVCESTLDGREAP